MAPALTEPISPKEKLTATTTTPSSTRSSRRIDSEKNYKTNNNHNNNNLKQSPPTLREKRNCNNNNNTIIPAAAVVQVPTTSATRLARSRDRLLSSPKCKESQQQSLRKSTIQTSTNDSTNNEQMGLSTAVLDTKNQIINQNTSTSAEQEHQQNIEAEATKIVEKSVNEDSTTANTTTSTAQLLADLTNEAITADICLRNQLKDVNLVKVAEEEGSASPLQRDNDIVVIKSNTAASPSTGLDNTAHHMDTQCSSEEDANANQTITTTTTTNESNTFHHQKLASEANKNDEIFQAGETNHVATTASTQHDSEAVFIQDSSATLQDDESGCNKSQNECRQLSSDTVAVNMDICSSAPAASPLGSTDSEEETKKEGNSKPEIISVEELPPVNTDSTMTASEVEDNLEERLSQLDGTAIDSPPPNNDADVDDKEDDVMMKSAQLIVESSHTNATSRTPPRTPTHQQSLAQDMQAIQQQLQHTPPTPISQQVQQQQNCLTPQSTVSSVNTVGSGNIPAAFIKEAEAGSATGAELEDQDIEEVFKVLKGFEGGTTSDLNVCDLNVLFNEVYMKMNDVSQSHVSVANNPSIQPVKPTELEEAQKDIEERQRQMQRRVDILMRRLRKLQSRYMCKHTSEEIAGLFELSARQLNKGVTNQHLDVNTGGSSDPTTNIIAARPPATDWKSEQEELVPAKQISTLLRKIETVANGQQHCLTTTTSSTITTSHHNNNFQLASTKKSKKALLEAQQNAATAAAAASNLKTMDTTSLNSSALEDRKAEDIIVATFDENVTTELTQVAGLLQSEMYEVQRAIDSDATESSSGGESADEMVIYNNEQQQTLPITKRAAWRYSRDRAAIASRWSWLLSQIADLEIKIRQHSELYQEIVKAKGPVVTCSHENGMKVVGGEVADNKDDLLEGTSCRTRGFNTSQFRKRKLIQTTNMHTISKKAARPSTIKCGCQWPIHPCALCTGRADPTAPRDLPDTMMMSERIALLDSGYHPVLSFRENVNNALHFEAIAKQPDWQQRVMRCPTKHIAKNVWKSEREAVAGGGGAPMKRRYVKKKDRDDKNTQQQQSRGTMPTSSSISDGTAAAGLTQMASSSTSCSVNDQTTTLATTTSTTPLVANSKLLISDQKWEKTNLPDTERCHIEGAAPQQQQPAIASPPPSTAAMNSIHQTSDCQPTMTSYDPYNLNPTHSSSISQQHPHSKSNKHRKLSSASTAAAATSHHYNQHHNNHHHLYNGVGESTFIHNNNNNYEWSAGGFDSLTARSRTSSPTHGGSGSTSYYHSKTERSFDRKNRVSYDIDNIVIPYSVAAATRVEILPYKEIPTPKWRIVNTPSAAASDETTNIEIVNQKNIASNGGGGGDDNEVGNEIHPSIQTSTKENECTKKSPPANPPVEEDEDKMKMVPPSLSVVVSSAQHKLSDKENNFKSDQTATTTTNSDVVDNASNCIENGQQINDAVISSCEIKEPQEKKAKIESNVIKVQIQQQPQTATSVSSSSSYTTSVQIANPNEKMNKKDTSGVAAADNTPDVVAGDEEEYCEDISDEAMILRHERALTEERRKFQTFLKFPWSTRSRANRRIDSRAESSGANTPDPSSPAPHTPSVGGGDQDSIPSPSTPSTPLNILDTISEAGDNSTSFLGVGFMPSHNSKRQERRRTTSAKRDFERRSSTPDSKELIPPYEPMKFPLTDEQFEELQSAMPSEHNEDSKRFDECYLPGRTRYCSGPAAAGTSSKRSSRSSTMCGGERRTKAAAGGGSIKTTSSTDDVNAMMTLETMQQHIHDEDYDDYPKHHLATNNDDHLTADDCDDPGGIMHDDMYGDDYLYSNRQQQRRHHRHIHDDDDGDSDGDSTETEPFQDDDPNDPEWRGETEDRSRKKTV
ncbi:uncharacterized protein LOC133329311 [Musca vetustissima]|uniref:uncharacterized protein LOC133329311 n=1 Tax=Musca vetustissima TaxID=27455 RepID=UPI002AB794E9|nr:uncharacterized protein LOC133329311 [Musca vetustissima]